VSPLAGWESFYVIVGSSAGALTGLMFVVITLVSAGQARGAGEEVGAYGTPNVVHFGIVLFVSAMLSAPWESLRVVGVLLVLTGVGGVTYAIIIFRRIIRRTRLHLEESYNPVLEDWLWFAIFPLTAYIALVVAAIMFLGNPTPAMFLIGAALFLLLVIGIHNAWDTVTFVAFERSQQGNTSDAGNNEQP
jgi:hypothetical protein